MLVIGTFPEEDGRATGSAKQEFADVRASSDARARTARRR